MEKAPLRSWRHRGASPPPWGYALPELGGAHSAGGRFSLEGLGTRPLMVKGITPSPWATGLGFGRVWAFEVTPSWSSGSEGGRATWLGAAEGPRSPRSLPLEKQLSISSAGCVGYSDKKIVSGFCPISGTELRKSLDFLK